MALKFSITRRSTSFLDPFNKFAPIEREVEIRQCPLTGDLTRVLPFRVRDLGKLDHGPFIERSMARPCPFCPEHRERMCARFLPEVAKDGHLTRGEAVCFPNAFPYETMNAVIVLTAAHYLRPSEFSPEVLANGLALAQDAFRRLAVGLAYASVNWNYMMPAGAGLVHPHFQVAAGKKPTRFQDVLLKKARAYARGGGDLIDDYIQAEKTAKKRWGGKMGPTCWMTPFAPRAIFDVMALMPGGKGLMDLKTPQLVKLGQGISRVITYFEERGVGAFNLAIHTSLTKDAGLPFMLRLVSRVDIPPMGVDEINYFEKLHDEMITFLPPEELALELEGRWG
jgi:UDPglucose--hexose-1-phosphate uridylyltransferase